MNDIEEAEKIWRKELNNLFRCLSATGLFIGFAIGKGSEIGYFKPVTLAFFGIGMVAVLLGYRSVKKFREAIGTLTGDNNE